MILYFGDPAGALALLARDLPLAGVVLGRKGAPHAERLSARSRGVPSWTRPRLSDPTLQGTLSALTPTLIVSAFYPRRIPSEILAHAPGLNVHPSDLPQWRGPDPIYWTVRTGEASTALCVHRLEHAFDAGEVYARERVPVDPTERAGDLAERLEARGAELIAEVAQRWLAGDVPDGVPQAGEPTWAPYVRGDDLLLDFTQPATDVHRAVLAGAPWPGARFHPAPNAPYAEVLKGEPRLDLAPFGEPGAIRADGGALLVACGAGCYAIRVARRASKLFVSRKLTRLL